MELICLRRESSFSFSHFLTSFPSFSLSLLQDVMRPQEVTGELLVETLLVGFKRPPYKAPLFTFVLKLRKKNLS